MINRIKDIIFRSEIILANRLTKDANKYITQDFIEYCSSGHIATYKEIIEYYKNCTARECKIIDFNIEMINNEVAQAKYISELAEKRVLRSSLWRLTNGEWKMFFHQGTPTNSK